MRSSGLRQRPSVSGSTLTDTDVYDDLGIPVSQPNLAVTDGFAVMLTPLPTGSHTIAVRVESLDQPLFGDVVFDITYHLTVGP